MCSDVAKSLKKSDTEYKELLEEEEDDEDDDDDAKDKDEVVVLWREG